MCSCGAAAAYLASRADVRPGGLGCVGLSGGGCRAALLHGIGDWPDLVACRAPSPLMVQYLLHDALFPVAGMRAAHERLAEEYQRRSAAEAYIGEFHPGPHRFDADMQDSAFTWLAGRLLD
jgi:hypothetical protein